MRQLLWIILAFALCAPVYGQNLLLDDYPGAQAAYSLRKIDKDYVGDALQVVRTSDYTSAEIGFVSDTLDVDSLESFCAATDCLVTRWYDQSGDTVFNGSPLHPGDAVGTEDTVRVVISGTVVRDDSSKVALDFQRTDKMVTLTQANQVTFDTDSLTVLYAFTDKGNEGVSGNRPSLFHFTEDKTPNTSFTVITWSNAEYGYKVEDVGGGDAAHFSSPTAKGSHIAGMSSQIGYVYTNHSLYFSNASMAGPPDDDDDYLAVGGNSEFNSGGNLNALFNEFIVYPFIHQDSTDTILGIYNDMNAYWKLGPTGYDPDAVLPDQTQEMVTMRNWMKAINDTSYTTLFGQVADTDSMFVADTTSLKATFSYDQIADLYRHVKHITLSSVVRSRACDYILDDGAGCGIETVDPAEAPWIPVDSDNDPFTNNYPGNNARSYGNEPCIIADLHLHRKGLSEGNKFYRNKNLQRRCQIVNIYDMMMTWWSIFVDGDQFGSRTDMFGKRMLAWGNGYFLGKEVLPDSVQAAYEGLFEKFVDKIIDQGAQGVNTNMDMFSLPGMAYMWAAANDSLLKEKAWQASNRLLLGYTDGEWDVKHQPFGDPQGVMHPSGCVLEGNQCEVFYGGESRYHLANALAVLQRENFGRTPDDWQQLEESFKRLLKWEAYQAFNDPAKHDNQSHEYNPASKVYNTGAGFSGRTSAGVPDGQEGSDMKDLMQQIAAPEFAAWRWDGGTCEDQSSMLAEIQSVADNLQASILNVYTGGPNTYVDASPWAKKPPFSPARGGCTYAEAIDTERPDWSDHPSTRRAPYSVNLGDSFWAYSDTTSSGNAFGWFIEAMSDQGNYAGWHGGKIETFWTDSTGTALISRKSKSGCDGVTELSTCYDLAPEWLAQHMWGRADNDSVFTTLLIRGTELKRESYIDADAHTTQDTANVWVANHFNDPSLDLSGSRTGEETGNELEGTFYEVRKFKALDDGLRVEHHITSDGTDQIKELWVTIPVFSKEGKGSKPNGRQQFLASTLIEWDSLGTWVEMDTLRGHYYETVGNADGVYSGQIDTMFVTNWNESLVSGDRLLIKETGERPTLSADAPSGSTYILFDSKNVGSVSDGDQVMKLFKHEYGSTSFDLADSTSIPTKTIRLMRDWGLGGGPQYVYIQSDSVRTWRTGPEYNDPYQTQTTGRPLNIDVHGNPGTSENAPTSRLIAYEIRLTDPR